MEHHFVYCTVVHCTVMYCTVQYCTVLNCTVLYCTVLYTLSYPAILYTRYHLVNTIGINKCNGLEGGERPTASNAPRKNASMGRRQTLLPKTADSRTSGLLCPPPGWSPDQKRTVTFFSVDKNYYIVRNRDDKSSKYDPYTTLIILRNTHMSDRSRSRII